MSGSYMHHDFWCKWPLHLALQDEEVLWIDGWKKEEKRDRSGHQQRQAGNRPVRFKY